MAKKRDACVEVDTERLLSDLESPDEVVRGDAVRALCPCHAGWEVFERHVSVVLRLVRDPSREVRAHALHVFDDAARMQLKGDVEYFLRDAEGEGRGRRERRVRGPKARRRGAAPE